MIAKGLGYKDCAGGLICYKNKGNECVGLKRYFARPLKKRAEDSAFSVLQVDNGSN
jgi:hypothetical protein